MKRPYEEFAEKLIKSLVNKTEKVKIEKIVNERGVLLTLDVDPSDIGTIIGKKGKNIQAIRHLIRLVGLKNRAWVSLKLNTIPS